MTDFHQLADEVGSHERTLRRAFSDGLIRGGRPSPKRLAVSAPEREWVRRHWPLVREVRAVLRTEKSVRLAVLFGSLARGEERAGSDLDLLVAFHRGEDGRPVELEQKLAAATGRRAQVVTTAQALRAPALLAEIAADGRVLTDRDGGWAVLARAGRRAGAELEDVDELLAALEPSL